MIMRKTLFCLLTLLGLSLNSNVALSAITIEIEEGVERGVPIANVPIGDEDKEDLQFSVITIEIEEGVERGVPIAIVPFGGEVKEDLQFSLEEVIRNDLYRTGKFDPIPIDQYPSHPTSSDSVVFSDWQLIEADLVLIGRVEPDEAKPDHYRIITRLYDSFEQKQVFGVQFIISADKFRQIAHRIANSVFEKVTDQESSFDTKILYTTSNSNSNGGSAEHALYIADYDGYNPQTILRTERPILSPVWSPDGTKIAYAELFVGYSLIYIQEVATGERTSIAAPNGYNSAPSWSPDGERLAFSHSNEGNFEIYIYSIDEQRLTQVTDHHQIDTEPSWRPDGKRLVFTSNRGITPQIYEAPPRRKARAKRVDIDGRSNSGASYSPTGEQLVVITDQGIGKQVGIYDFSAETTRVISSTTLDDSAKFSPHGDMVIHVVEGSKRYIKILSPDGRVATRVPVVEGQVKQVDWASF